MTSMNKAALLAQKDREIEKQLIKISLDAVPKKIKEQPVNIGKKPIYTRILEGTPEYMAQKIQTDRMLDSQLETISTNATRDFVSGPPKLVSAVTQEMIDEYKAESSKPLVVGGVAYKYHPVASLAALNLEQFDPTQFHIMTPDERANADADIHDLRLEIKGYNDDIMAYVKRKEQLRDDYDLNVLGLSAKKEKQLTTDFEDELRKIDDLIKDCTVNIAKAETDIRQKEQYIEATSNDQQLYDAEKFRVDSINKQKLNDATDEFNNLNTGRLNMEQNTNETDAEYLDRLREVGIKPATVEEVTSSSEIVNTMRAQKNLEELLSDKGKIGNIVKYLTNVEQFEFNKRFPRIKKKYLEEYGFNNKQVTDREIYEFIVEQLATPAQLPAAPAVAQVAPTVTVTAPSTPQARTKPLPAEVLTGKKASGAAAQQQIKTHTGPLPGELMMAQATVKQPSAKELFKIDMTNAGLKPSNKTSEVMVRELMDAGSPINPYALKKAKDFDVTLQKDAIAYMVEKQRVLTGVGIKKLSTNMPFGKIRINPDKLYYKNTLVIRRLKDNKPITGHRDIVVSDAFVEIIFKIINGKSITKANIKDLSNNEKMLYDNLIMQSGLHKTQPHTIDESSQQMKKRVDLIVGEIQAGNSNKALLQELHSLLNKMAYLNMIPVRQAALFYKSIKTQYF